jgi:hypothetical protein
VRRAIKARPEWRRWFAWHPIRIGRERIWWEWVERRWHGGGFGDGVFEYRGVPEWPYCCDQMRGPMWLDGKLQESWCPTHGDGS